jgi:DNA excision repair protein ERCC-4
MTVGESLERHQPEVVELQQPMTKAMEQLQEAIVQVMDACLQELKKTNQVRSQRCARACVRVHVSIFAVRC